jgi:glyceraldehyde 3-phosphate dehydrogenase
MTIRVGINGFGRIGRNIFRAAIDDEGIDIIAVNDLTDAETLAHLLKYDSIHGILRSDIRSEERKIIVDGKEMEVLAERDPEALPWEELDVNIVVESTGRFTDRTNASKHLKAGCEKVVISAPAKDPDVTIVIGVNEDAYDPKHKIISAASCTTNCLAPMAKVLNDEFGIEKGFMTTVHAYTNDQSLLDVQHKDLRRARSAGMSLIPTTTGASRAVSLVLPELKGKLDGLAMRIPTPNVSIVDFVAELKRDTTVDEVNGAFDEGARGKMKGLLDVSYEPLVSVDYVGNSCSSIIDALSTMTMGNLSKVLSWYDNEWGYSCRVVDLIELVSR